MTPLPVDAPAEAGALDPREAGEEVPYADLIRRAARETGLEPALIAAVIQTESSFNPKAVSPVGAQGLMQLMPATAKELGVKDPFDPEQNILGGSRYLKKLLDRYHGDRSQALAAYNWGMGNVERRPDAMPGETRRYVARVNGLTDHMNV
ncbi:MAG: lytic transglycosylase domain-containing protein [Magnetococcales bacterium]|nr:lytic transglycosylase domain-containing protein [Magnetococcales bacterium]